MANLFKKKDVVEKRSVRRELRLTHAETDAIRHSALIRNMSEAEYIRRAALGRHAEVRYEVETVLRIRDVVQSIRALHGAFVADMVVPKEAELERIIEAANAALLRVGQ